MSESKVTNLPEPNAVLLSGKESELLPDEQIPSRLAITPTPGVDPMDALATSMYGSQGLYAVLLGAGMSLSAGQPSAWEILRSLINELRKSSGEELDTSDMSPEDWWKRNNTDEEPSYGTVLESLAPTPGARQQRLQKYFQPNGYGQQSEISPAHKHLAELCAIGNIKVVLTTNFDRLIEQALSARGVLYNVIEPHGISGMTPLVHAPVTVLKLHGDYQSINIRNTSKELSQYSLKLASKLKEIFRDYGLIVVGWSGQWDSALRDLIQRNSSRIYPMYWVAHNGDLTETARKLVENRQAFPINSGGADEFFSDLHLRIDRLSRVAQRKTQPVFLRDNRYSPYSFVQLPDNPPPALLLRTAVTFGPTTINDSGLISATEHRKLFDAIDNHPFSNQLRDLAGAGSLYNQGSQPWLDRFPKWEFSVLDGTPSGDLIAFRLNLDTDGLNPIVKIFARLIVHTPANGTAGDNFLTFLDIGITASRKLAINEVATMFRGSLEVLTDVIPEALADITPPGALPNCAELYIVRTELRDGTGGHPINLDEYLDLSPLGSRARKSGGGLDQLNASAQLHGPIIDRDAADLTVRAIERMVLNAGYLNYESVMKNLRYEMLALLDD